MKYPYNEFTQLDLQFHSNYDVLLVGQHDVVVLGDFNLGPDDKSMYTLISMSITIQIVHSCVTDLLFMYNTCILVTFLKFQNVTSMCSISIKFLATKSITVKPPIVNPLR